MACRREYNRCVGPSRQKASCTGAKWGCTGAKEGLGGAKDSWETFAPLVQMHPPQTTLEQDKMQHLDFTKEPRPLYYKTPPCVFFLHTNVRSKAVFGP